MTKPLIPVVQSELLRGPSPLTPPPEAMIFSSGHKGWKDDLSNIEKVLGEKDVRPAVFGSIEACQHILRELPFLARGVVVDFEAMRFSQAMSYIPSKMRFNTDYILLPFGEILGRKDQITTLFGDRIFLRPDSSRKTFTGLSIPMGDFEQELHALSQIHAISPAELCVIDRHRPMRRSEFRTWLIDGKLCASASYSQFGISSVPVPESVLHAAERLAAHLEYIENAVVADFAICPQEDKPLLLELNGMSTSGLYPDADFQGILQGLDGLLL